MMKRFRSKERRCIIFNKKNPVMKITGFFYVLSLKKSGKDPDYNSDYKYNDEDSNAHSSFKNVSNNFTACK